MGSSFSASTSPAAAVAVSSTSAKVITISGVLKEYAAAPIPGSIVLADCVSPAEADPPCFLCHADSLSYDEPVPALAPDDPVLPGRLYFVLPEGMQRRPLSGADMGALAVRASRALETAASGFSGGRGGKGAKKKKGRALKVSPVLVESIIGIDGSFSDEWCGDGKQRTAVLSSSTLKPGQLKKSGFALAAAGQRRGSGGRGSRYARRGGSFRGRLGTIEEDATE